jgi:hypothetical protein
MIRVILCQRQPHHEQLLVAKSQWREFFCPADENSPWRTRLWFEDGSAQTKRMMLPDVQKCLRSALSEGDVGSVLEVYDIDAFRVLAGPLAADIQWG